MRAGIGGIALQCEGELRDALVKRTVGATERGQGEGQNPHQHARSAVIGAGQTRRMEGGADGHARGGPSGFGRVG